MKAFYSVLLIVVIFIGCSNPTIIPESKMKVLVWELMKNSYDSTNKTFKFSGKFTDDDLGPLNEILKKNNVTSQEFYYSFDLYQQDPAKLKIFLDTVLAYGGRELYKPITSPPAKANKKLVPAT